jgi:hypothetical protein
MLLLSRRADSRGSRIRGVVSLRITLHSGETLELEEGDIACSRRDHGRLLS